RNAAPASTPAKPRSRRAKRANSNPAAAKQAAARRAAFTLRLDTERHLKLRLAATMQGISAQSLVTEALDALLEDIDDLDTLVARMKRTGPQTN
ncbi:MAG: toxin-antitoxin system HicB family antitoxin, partial [Pseudomonadota bacterium]